MLQTRPFDRQDNWATAVSYMFALDVKRPITSLTIVFGLSSSMVQLFIAFMGHPTDLIRYNT